MINKIRILVLNLVIGFICVAFVACDNSKFVFPKSTFATPFPKKNKDLTAILGSKLILKVGNDTMKLKITDFGKANMITADDKTGDTLFYGTVSKYRGMLYFSQKINDTCHWIFGVKESANKIYGLNGMFEEQLQLEREALKGKYPKLVKYFNKDTSVIRLYADKNSIRKILEPFVDTMRPCIMLSSPPAPFSNEKHMDTVVFPVIPFAANTDSTDFDLISKVYPNPTSGFVNVELQEKERVFYKLNNAYGKPFMNGEFEDITGKIDISNLPDGLYILTVSTPDNKTLESVKLIKQ